MIKFHIKILSVVLAYLCGITDGYTSREIHIELFDNKDPTDIKALKAIDQILAKIHEEESNKPHPQTTNQITWWKNYIGEEAFNSYSEQRAKELVAEATVHAIQTGFDKEIKQMTFEQLATFAPLEEAVIKRTLLGKKIERFKHALVKPQMSHEVSWAIQQAAWSIYIHTHSYAGYKQKQAEYDAKRGRL